MKKILDKFVAVHGWQRIKAKEDFSDKERIILINEDKEAIIYKNERNALESVLPIIRDDSLQQKSSDFYLTKEEMQELGFDYYSLENDKSAICWVEEIETFINEQKEYGS